MIVYKNKWFHSGFDDLKCLALPNPFLFWERERERETERERERHLVV